MMIQDDVLRDQLSGMFAIIIGLKTLGSKPSWAFSWERDEKLVLKIFFTDYKFGRSLVIRSDPMKMWCQIRPLPPPVNHAAPQKK